MVNEQDFSLINVSSDEEDDVVIEAGSRGLSDEQPADATGEEQPLQQPEQKTVHSADALLTTEEDLHAPVPFAGMQRAIVVAFVLLLVAAVAYWFFIRPLGA